MRHYGIGIKEICLLGFGPKLISFTLKRFFPGTLLSVRLIPLGAFVSTKEEDALSKLSEDKRAHISAGGPAANFLYAGVLALAALLVAWPTLPIILLVSFPIALVLGGVLFTKKSLARNLMFLLGLTQFPLIIWSYWTLGVLGSSGSVDTTVLILNEKSVSLFTALFLSFIISAGLGLINTMPLPGLDGGHTALPMIKRFCDSKLPGSWRYVKATSIGMLAWLILTSLGGDFYNLLKH